MTVQFINSTAWNALLSGTPEDTSIGDQNTSESENECRKPKKCDSLTDRLCHRRNTLRKYSIGPNFCEVQQGLRAIVDGLYQYLD